MKSNYLQEMNPSAITRMKQKELSQPGEAGGGGLFRVPAGLSRTVV